MIDMDDPAYCGHVHAEGGYVCTRQPGHSGVHIATTESICAEWRPDGTPVDEESIRLSERDRLADLLDEHAHDGGAFTADTVATVRMVALLLRLKP